MGLQGIQPDYGCSLSYRLGDSNPDDVAIESVNLGLFVRNSGFCHELLRANNRMEHEQATSNDGRVSGYTLMITVESRPSLIENIG